MENYSCLTFQDCEFHNVNNQARAECSSKTPPAPYPQLQHLGSCTGKDCDEEFLNKMHNAKCNGVKIIHSDKINTPKLPPECERANTLCMHHSDFQNCAKNLGCHVVKETP